MIVSRRREINRKVAEWHQGWASKSHPHFSDQKKYFFTIEPTNPAAELLQVYLNDDQSFKVKQMPTNVRDI